MNKDIYHLLTSFFYNTTIPLVICDLDFNFMELNEGAEEILIGNKEDFIGKSLLDITHKDSIAVDFQNFRKLISKKISSYELRLDYDAGIGTKIEAAIKISLLKFKEETYLVGAFQKEKSRNEDFSFLSSKGDKLDKILSLNPDLHYILDIDQKAYIYQNENILTYFGYNSDDLDGMNETEFLISKIDEKSITNVKNAKHEFNEEKSIGEFVEVEYKIVTKEGEWKWLRARSTPLVQDSFGIVKISYGILQDITEQKEIQTQLKSQQEFIEEVTQIFPDVIYVHGANPYKTIYSNLKENTFLGYNEQEWGDGVAKPDPDYEDKMANLRKNEADLKDGEVLVTESLFISKSGESRWLRFKKKVFKRDKDGVPIQFLGTVSDIHEYKMTLEELALNQATTSAILKSIPDLILIVNKDGHYLKTYSGQKLKIENDLELIGKNVKDVIAEPTASILLDCIEKCLNNEEVEAVEFEHLEPDGDYQYYSNHFSKVSDKEVLILARNISQRKRAELERNENLDLLSVQNEQLEKFINKNVELERFAYIVSHDLKEPLRSISSLSEIVNSKLEKYGDKELSKLMNHLSDTSDRMHSMIHGVLEYSKLDAKSIVHTPVDLNETIEGVLKDLNSLIKERSADVRVKKLPIVLGNNIQLRQLFQNLINNAIKFNESEKVLVEVDFQQTKDESGYKFKIKDNGIGIDEQFKTSIFKMFKKVHSKTAYTGHGLGLTICKKIVDHHHGEIWVEDNTHGGSTFCFTLPKIEKK